MIVNETSFLIASDHPLKLAQFYSLLLGTEIVQGLSNKHYLVIYKKICKLQIYTPSRDKHLTTRPQSSVSICFAKEPSSDSFSAIKKWIKEISKLGGKLSDGPFSESFGSEAWIADPQGNNFLIFVPQYLPN
ncbi:MULTISPECIES: glyoxalase/bleomycin resistance/dioxygenase family protein [Prochlorococcus]|uniref:glyoxalase/bleomycin resistance/dioxygenase family protein n=1 Tax=Prochlorococcus TaxID=1218 RepID=UPI00053399DE|nr:MULTISPECIES: glyoxalase/bleomycin resistance/dioxygenase family protein [Prochlorococcus]KGG12555.1 lactoylglutathione lyase family enzyme [Prochlorococcus sp. MIT 0601]